MLDSIIDKINEYQDYLYATNDTIKNIIETIKNGLSNLKNVDIGKIGGFFK